MPRTDALQDDGTTTAGGRTSTTDSGSTTRGDPQAPTSADGSSGGLDSTSSGGFIYDVMPEATGTTGSRQACHVVGELDAVGACEDVAPPGSFEPEVQWSWTGPDGDNYSIVTPLVANLTDDNGDGSIDLCDTPDIVVVVGTSGGSPFGFPGQIYVLDGATGSEHFHIDAASNVTTTPALGDLDGDGVVEIVTAAANGDIVAYDHEGTLLFSEPADWPYIGDGGTISGYYGAAIALADVDNDGDVEIIAGNFIADHEGQTVVTFDEPAGWWSATAAADLDGDGDLEIVLGHAAFHHDGTPAYVTDLQPGYPQIADLDADPEPEILLVNPLGISLIDHDGTVQYQDENPTAVDAWPGGELDERVLMRPATVHDFDGDGGPEYAVSSREFYSVYEPDGSLLWSVPVADLSGIAAGTAFDFLGDGVPEAMYADESQLFVFDSGSGDVLLQSPRSSATLTEYPVVADVDNDGSAEIVVTSNPFAGGGSPTVQVIRDAEDRWIQARRIWNQHTYHVTNVREDGTIPTHETPHWSLLNTYRTNAQIDASGVCDPPPQG
ncbi:MAG: VCBS repeat-containing protein [Myxococcota bacterium]